jgi:hypothetical protein
MNSSDKRHFTLSKNEQRLFIILSILGIILIGVFGLRTIRSSIRLQKMGLKPGTTDVEAIRGWMTVPYIARAYGVPEAYLFQELAIPAEKNQQKSLAQINRDYAFGKKGVIVEAVKAAIKKYQTEHPLPSPSPHE